MSSILNHKDNKKNPDKNVNVKAKNISRNDIGFGNHDEQVVNFDVNMRINNHTRNAVLSLAKIIGNKETANSVISDLIDSHVTKLNDNEFEMYKNLFNAYEQKDKLSFQLKNK